MIDLISEIYQLYYSWTKKETSNADYQVYGGLKIP